MDSKYDVGGVGENTFGFTTLTARKKIHMIVNNSLLPSLTNILSRKTKVIFCVKRERKQVVVLL